MIAQPTFTKKENKGQKTFKVRFRDCSTHYPLNEPYQLEKLLCKRKMHAIQKIIQQRATMYIFQ